VRARAARVVGGAALVAAICALAGCSGSGSGSSPVRTGANPVGTAALTAPDRLGGYSKFADSPLSRQGRGKATADRVRSWNERSVERLSRTYGGAAATVETYADDGLETRFSLLAARASTPFPPFVPYQDPAALGVAKPTQELVSFGDVACVVRNDSTPAGRTPRAGSAHVASCVRTGPQLTVQIQDVGGDLGEQPAAVARLVDEAWSALS
jgi:hypothetical protein